MDAFGDTEPHATLVTLFGGDERGEREVRARVRSGRLFYFYDVGAIARRFVTNSIRWVRMDSRFAAGASADSMKPESARTILATLSEAERQSLVTILERGHVDDLTNKTAFRLYARPTGLDQIRHKHESLFASEGEAAVVLEYFSKQYDSKLNLPKIIDIGTEVSDPRVTTIVDELQRQVGPKSAAKGQKLPTGFSIRTRASLVFYFPPTTPGILMLLAANGVRLSQLLYDIKDACRSVDLSESLSPWLEA